MALPARDTALMLALHRVVRDVDTRTAAICRQHGITLGQYSVLEALMKQGPLCVREIKDAVQGSDGNIPVIINNLARAGLVLRNRDPYELRRTIVELTEEGAHLVAIIHKQNSAMLKERMKPWDLPGRRGLLDSLNAYLTQ